MVIFFLLLLITVPVHAEGMKVFAYGDISWGTPYNQAKNILISKHGRIMELSDRDNAKYLRVYHKIKSTKFDFVEYCFLKGKLRSCAIHAPSDVLEKYFVKKYGKPTLIANRSVDYFRSIRSNGTYDAKDPVWEGTNATAMIKTVSEHRSIDVVGLIEEKR